MSLYVDGVLTSQLTQDCRYLNDAGNLCIIADVLPNRRGHIEYEKLTRQFSLKHAPADPFLAMVFSHVTEEQVKCLLNLMVDVNHFQEGEVVQYKGIPYTVLRVLDGDLILLSAGPELVVVPADGLAVLDTNTEWSAIWDAVNAELHGRTKFRYSLRIPALDMRVRLRKLRPCVECASATKLQCPNLCGTKYCPPCWQAASEAHFVTCAPVLCATCAAPSRRQCSGCHRVPYCSAKCQKTNWSEHRPQCAIVL